MISDPVPNGPARLGKLSAFVTRWSKIKGKNLDKLGFLYSQQFILFVINFFFNFFLFVINLWLPILTKVIIQRVAKVIVEIIHIFRVLVFT